MPGRHAAGLDGTYREFEPMRWRTGRRVGQCVHAQVNADPSEDDVLLFECPSPSIAQLVVREHNVAWGWG